MEYTEEQKKINDISVENPVEITNKTNVFVIVASRNYGRQMAYQLRKMGYKPHNDFGVWIDYTFGVYEKVLWELQCFLRRDLFTQSYFYNLIQRYIIDPISGWMRINHVPLFYNGYEMIDNIRNYYKNERCFILLNGPSLVKEDFLKLTNEYTFGTNSFFVLTEATGWKPTFYYTVNEPTVEEIFVDHKLSPKDVCKKHMFIGSNCSSFGYYEQVGHIPILAPQPYGLLSFYPKKMRHSNDALFGLT